MGLMDGRDRRGSRAFRPGPGRLESRLVMSSHASIAADVQALLKKAGGGAPIRPNTPVVPLEAPTATASFIDPTVRVVSGKRQTVGQKDYIAPFVTLNAKNGYIVIGSSSSIEDGARLIANPHRQSGLTGIFVGDNVVISDNAVIRGAAAIGGTKGAATYVGPGALIDGAVIEPGAFVGALARVGPGVTVPTGFRVLPGADVTTDAEASDPTLGDVVKVTSDDKATATKLVANNVALAAGYVTLYQGNSAAGGATSAGPIPSAIAAS